MDYCEKLLKIQPEETELWSEMNQKKGIYEKEKELKEMALSIVNEETYDFKDSAILSGEFQNLIADLTAPVFFKADTDRYIGIYVGGYIYYGDLNDGMREGKGYWYYGNMKSMNVVSGTWKNDYPNGDVTIESYINPDAIEREEGHTYAIYTKKTGKVTNGIFQGRWNICYDMENEETCDHEWNVDYVDGMLQPISGDERNAARNAAKCIKCRANLLVNDQVHQISGILP